MKPLLRVLSVVGLVLLGSSAAFAVDPFDSQSLQVRKFFVNQNASALTSGTAVVLTYNEANVTTGTTKNASTTLGAHIDTTTIANNKSFVGIIHQDSCATNNICEVTVYGPEIALVECSTSNVTTPGNALGTGTVAGQLGSGTRAGILLAPGPVQGAAAIDGCLKWVFVNPSPAS